MKSLKKGTLLTKEALLKILEDCQYDGDKEAAHQRADLALLCFINDEEICKAFDKIDKWYA